MTKWSRVSAAVAALIGSAFIAPQSAFACSGPVPTLQELTTSAALIFAGRVSSKPHEWAYELAVDEVFRGPTLDSVRIGPATASTPQICSHQLKVGDRVVVALRDREDLGLFSSAVWYLMPDGSVGTIGAEPPAATHNELFAYLRRLPDTAMAPRPQLGSSLRTLGIAVLAAALTISFGLRASRPDAESVARPWR